MIDLVKNWDFDLLSAAIAAMASPLVIYLAKILLTAMQRWCGHLLEAGIYFGARSFRRSLAGTLTLKHYCRLQLATPNQYLHVPSRLDVRLHIDSVFVTLNLESHGTVQKTYSHIDLLEAGNRIIVVGDPGSGKSSLVKWLLRNTCRQAVEKSAIAKLPVLIELRKLPSPPETDDRMKLGKWLYLELLKEISEARVYRMDECFESYVQSSGVMLLLDGLDEISAKDYQKVEAAILEMSNILAQASTNNAIVLTMRLQFYQQIRDAFRSDFSATMSLRPFSPSDIYEFLTRWPFSREAGNSADRIYKELTDRPTLREMCRNPLVLSMYVAEDQATGTHQPSETRTQFYQKVTDELIITRRLHQSGASINASTKLKEQRERILGRIAMTHLLDDEQPTNMLRFSEAIGIAKEIIGCAHEEAEIIFREIAKETGIITEERIGTSFRFIHLTFCEFLAANEAAHGEESGWEALIQAHRDLISRNDPHLRSRLVEVIPFAAGLLSRSRRDSALDDLLELNDSRLLARAFLETKLYEHAGWLEFVDRQARELLDTPEDGWDETWLQDLYIFNVVLRDAIHCSQYAPKIPITINPGTFFKSLIERQRDSLQKLLTLCASSDAAAAFRLAEVCGVAIENFPETVVVNCDQKHFFDLVCKEALSERNWQMKLLWYTYLAEAALRSNLVASWMAGSAPDPLLGQHIKKIPRNRRWHRAGVIESSLLTQCITLALSNSAVTMPLVTVLQTVEAPGSIPWIGTRNASISLISIPIAIGILISTSISIPKVAFLLACILAWAYTMTRYHLIQEAYERIVGANYQPAENRDRIKMMTQRSAIEDIFPGRRLRLIHFFEIERAEILARNLWSLMLNKNFRKGYYAFTPEINSLPHSADTSIGE